MDFDLIRGLPIHPLVVHAAVVLVPLTALGLLLMALLPRFSRANGWLVVAIGAAAAVASVVARLSGIALQQRTAAPRFDHAELGGSMPWFAGALLLATAGLWLVDRREAAAGSSGRRGVRGAVAVVAVAVALANLVWIYRVGDSGARSVWSGRVVVAASVSAPSG
jgi:uncharacterized membrane protein